MAKHPFLARIWGIKVAENVKSDLKKLGFTEFYTLSKTDAFGYFFTSKYELITTTNKEITKGISFTQSIKFGKS